MELLNKRQNAGFISFDSIRAHGLSVLVDDTRSELKSPTDIRKHESTVCVLIVMLVVACVLSFWLLWAKITGGI